MVVSSVLGLLAAHGVGLLVRARPDNEDQRARRRLHLYRGGTRPPWLGNGFRGHGQDVPVEDPLADSSAWPLQIYLFRQ